MTVQSKMTHDSIEKAIKDCGLPGRLVELDGRLITLDLLNDHSEKLERFELGMSEFCDLLLDWRQKLIAREDSPTVARVRTTA
ncbi:MAG: hypothetical protein QOE92_1001, partial [Chloroflexota bacterium]|nr:hypothetical protein [Chloroflexota bacterium]